jgi:hypothetical protein
VSPDDKRLFNVRRLRRAGDKAGKAMIANRDAGVRFLQIVDYL